MKKTILLTIVIALFGSCHQKGKQNQDMAVIDLSEALKLDTTIMLSDITNDIEYVPLETKPECVLGDYWNVSAKVLDHYIIVSDRSQSRKPLPLKLFSRKGKYIGEIGRIGQGPGEYNNVSNFTCLEDADRIYILTNYPSTLVVFNFNRDCIGTIPLSENPAKMVVMDPDRIGIMYLPHREMENDTARFEWIDSKGEVLESVPLYQDRPKDGGGMSKLSARLQIIDNDIHFIETPFDTVYRLSPNKRFEPVWSYNIGPDKIPNELRFDIMKFNENFRTYGFIERSFETPDYFFINVIHKQRNKTIFYNKKTWTASWLRPNDGYEGFFLGTQGFVNDIDGGVPFWPKSRTGNLLVSMTAPEVLLPALQNNPTSNIKIRRPDLKERLDEMRDKIKMDDNPIVVIVKNK